MTYRDTLAFANGYIAYLPITIMTGDCMLNPPM